MLIVPYTRISTVEPEEDDRTEAAKWFVAMLIQHEVERGRTQVDIGEHLHRDKGQVSLLRSGSAGVGFSTWFLIADWQRRNPGEMLDEALEWWSARGPAWRDEHLEKLKEKRRRKQRTAENGSTEGSPRVSSLPPTADSAHEDKARRLKGRGRVRRKDTGKQ